MKTSNHSQYKPINKPYVTATVPVYNEESCIKDCILSLLDQDFKPLEILVVDDGSKDNSVKICESLQVRVLKQNHKGLGAARNLGASNAKGNILVLADADIVYSPDYISKMVAPIIKGETIATCHWNETVANWHNPWARCQTWYRGLPDKRRQPLTVPEHSGEYRAVRKDFFLNSGGLAEEEGYKTDGSLSRKTGYFAKIVPDASCYHRNIEDLGELFKEALWQGRHNAISREHRFRRFFAVLLINKNPLFEILRGIRLGLLKKEPRMFSYSITYTIGFIIGNIHAICCDYYEK
jgi:glycosyltransferase involved in cell wall biosynthesis